MSYCDFVYANVLSYEINIVCLNQKLELGSLSLHPKIMKNVKIFTE